MATIQYTMGRLSQSGGVEQGIDSLRYPTLPDDEAVQRGWGHPVDETGVLGVSRTGLPNPGGVADNAAEVAADERGVLVGEDVGLDVAEGGLGPLVDAVVEGLDDVFLELGGAGILGDDGVAELVGVLLVGDSEHVHLHATGEEGDDGVHELGNAGGGGQGDGGPYVVDVLRGDAARLEEVAGGVGTVDLEAVGRALAGHEAHVVEHGSGIE